MLSVPFERDFQKIAKINSQQTSLFQSQKLVPKKQKNRQSAKLDPRKNLVPRGRYLSFVFDVKFLADPLRKWSEKKK